MSKQELISEFAQKMLTAVDAVSDFGKEQIPVYVEQVLTYMFYENVAVYGFLFLIALAILGIGYKIVWSIAEYNDDNSMKFLILVPVFIFMMITTLNAHRLLEAVKIKVAPKVYIVEYFSKIINPPRNNH